MGITQAYSDRSLHGQQSGSNRRALCIGIDNYPVARDRLSGCIKDARRWKQWFESQGFTVTELIDEQASRSGIINSVRNLITSARPGDVIAIQQSSHGTQFPDQSGDESDKLDEAMVPYDHRQNGYVFDDDLAAVCNLIPDGVNVTFFLDMCHSGTITRAFFAGPPPLDQNGVRERFLRPDQEMLEVYRQSRTRDVSRGARSPYAERREILFSACRADQTAKETPGHGGHFSLSALETLQRGLGNLSNADFLEGVREAGRQLFRNQVPELWSDASMYDQPLLAAQAGNEDESDSFLSPPEAKQTDVRGLINEMQSLCERLKEAVSGS